MRFVSHGFCEGAQGLRFTCCSCQIAPSACVCLLESGTKASARLRYVAQRWQAWLAAPKESLLSKLRRATRKESLEPLVGFLKPARTARPINGAHSAHKHLATTSHSFPTLPRAYRSSPKLRAVLRAHAMRSQSHLSLSTLAGTEAHKQDISGYVLG